MLSRLVDVLYTILCHCWTAKSSPHGMIPSLPVCFNVFSTD